MKHFYLILFSLLITATSFAQLVPPTDLQTYYTDVDFTKTGTDLYDNLAVETISKHTTILSYDSRHSYLYNADEDLSNPANVILVYSGESRNKTEYLSGSNPNMPQTFNTEHIYPQSLLDTGAAKGDLFSLRSCDTNINSSRSNKPFADSNSATYQNLGSSWFPGNEWKGDVARMVMYQNLRYNEPFDDVGTLALFLKWNTEDPVSDFEIKRNEYINTVQGNRNPFIDNPYIANVIWGTSSVGDAVNRWGVQPPADTEAPTIPTNLVASNPTSSSVDLAWATSTDNIAVTSYDIYVDNTLNSTTTSTSFTVTGLTPETTYTFTILAKDAIGNTSALSNSVNETTTAGSISTNDLFFSEYMEGSSNNKALEITNLTGADITDLSTYELRLSTNGNPAWTVTYNFPAGTSISNNDVYVIGNTNLAVCTGVVDDSNSSITGFNGNDAIGLFKNGTLIDILSTLGNNASFGKNTTLVRNSDITNGNTTFDSNQWTSSASNTCTNLGQLSRTLGITEAKINEFKIYPNPIKGTLLTVKVTENTRFKIYDIIGNKILKGNITPNNNKINLSSLNKGIYIIQLENNQGSISKKLIRQ